jgi:hypothetical protein
MRKLDRDTCRPERRGRWTKKNSVINAVQCQLALPVEIMVRKWTVIVRRHQNTMNVHSAWWISPRSNSMIPLLYIKST